MSRFCYRIAINILKKLAFANDFLKQLQVSLETVMRVCLRDNILHIHHEDLPTYKKGGSLVRNNYFWALKSIACYAGKGSDWEFDRDVWLALSRMLLFFSQSGYLGTSETLLEFEPNTSIPDVLRLVSNWL